MSDFHGYKDELDALRVLMKGFHYYNEEAAYFMRMILHKFRNVLYYYDPDKPMYEVPLSELVLNYTYTLTFCKELLDTRTEVGGCITHVVDGKRDDYLKELKSIKDKLTENLDKLTK